MLLMTIYIWDLMPQQPRTDLGNSFGTARFNYDLKMCKLVILAPIPLFSLCHTKNPHSSIKAVISNIKKEAKTDIKYSYLFRFKMIKRHYRAGGTLT